MIGRVMTAMSAMALSAASRVDERIPMDVLPPAIGREGSVEDEVAEEAEARPRRRTRRPRAQDGEGEVAPAA